MSMKYKLELTALLLCLLTINGTTLHNQDKVSRSAADSNRGNDLKWISAGDAKASDGTMLALNTYETAAGTRINVTSGEFKSRDAAEKEMELWLKPAKKLVTQEEKKDDSGHITGKRAIALFAREEPHFEYTAILWTYRARFYWVSSSSLADCLELEKKINAKLALPKPKK